MRIALQLGWIFVCLVVAFTARCANLRDVFFDGKIYFLDGDCYARMTRARLVSENPGSIIRHHNFENWPAGITPHTTAPLDYLIVGLAGVFQTAFLFSRVAETSVLRPQILDLAGALIGPLLGVAGTACLGIFLWRWRIRFGAAALFFYATSPILVHGTALGRPDHQALLLFLLTIAGLAELATALLGTTPDAQRSTYRWGLLAGVSWGLSLWVSLYEPLVLFAIIAGLWSVSKPHAFWCRERVPGWIAFAVILATALLLEGWRVSWPDPALRAAFANWKQTIGELNHLDPRSPLLYRWLGALIFLTPILLFLERKRQRLALPLLLLVAVIFALTIWQLRWGYFTGLAFCLSLPWQLAAFRKTWVASLVFIVALWPLAREWDDQLFPNDVAQRQQALQRREAASLRMIAEQMRSPEVGAFIAPWWLSPPMTYWSRQPGVAGTSHQSLPGIVDTARFYLASDPSEAAKILAGRQVQWVISDEASRVIGTSAALLGVEAPERPLALDLFEHPQNAPAFLTPSSSKEASRGNSLGGLLWGSREVAETAPVFHRLYRVDRAKLSP